MGDLQNKIKRLQEKINQRKISDVDYMADPANWVWVHATDYMPKINKDGERYIESTLMATQFEVARTSVHGVLNHVVVPNSGGDWSGKPIVVLASYNDVVSKNCNPQQIATEDTFFIPNPDTGLVLPPSTYIVMPAENNDKLFTIGKNVATYKTDNFTKEEEEEILFLNDWDRSKYEKYLSGDFPQYEVESFLGHDEKLIKLYNDSKDKKAFMRGIVEEDKYAILRMLLRDAVVKITLGEMGYRQVRGHEDEVSAKVCEVAENAGIKGSSNNKGHFYSLEYKLENVGCELLGLAEILENKDTAEICKYIRSTQNPMYYEIGKSLRIGSPLPNIYQAYTDTLAGYIYDLKTQAMYCGVPHRAKQFQTFAQKLEEGGLKGHSPFLDIALHRNADIITDRCNRAVESIRQDPKYYAELMSAIKAQEERTVLSARQGKSKNL